MYYFLENDTLVQGQTASCSDLMLAFRNCHRHCSDGTAVHMRSGPPRQCHLKKLRKCNDENNKIG